MKLLRQLSPIALCMGFLKQYLAFNLLFLSVFVFSLGYSQNYSLQFDGVDDKILVNDSPELNPSSGLTIETWLYPEAWAVNTWDGCVICKQATNPDKGYCLAVGADGRVDFCHSVDETWKSAVTAPVLELNNWAHIAGVYDGTEFSIYVNGVLQATASGEGTPTLGNGVDINLAENPTWSGRYFTGMMDEVRIWDFARSIEEIQADLAVELNGPQDGLVAYWSMNDGSGNLITDNSGNNNDGVLVNMDQLDWVDGFSLPGVDAGVVGIASPNTIGDGFSDRERIKLEVKNYSMTEVTNFTLQYKVNEGEYVTTVINDTLESFSSKIYSFPQTIDLSGYSEVLISGKVILEEDCNPENDEVSESVSKSNNYVLFNQEPHNSGGDGKTHLKTVYMPDDFSAYEKILLHVDLDCPPDGCDPYDQPACVNILHDGVKLEIARYITPFGIACGNWTFDITDFSPLLREKAIFESFIEVWGASGWLVSMELEFVPGVPEYPYVKIEPLWNETQWIYGDPEINDELPEKYIPISTTTERVKLRMTVTGHGRGNTLNAAEYAEFVHLIWVNNSDILDLSLWKDDCASNPCAPQNGSYEVSRAGWCPGQGVIPFEYNLEGMYEQGSELELNFSLADYTNLLNSGYNGSTHTPPYLMIQSYLIQYSSDGFVYIDDHNNYLENNSIDVFPNPSTGVYMVSGAETCINSITVYRIDGSVLIHYVVPGMSSHSIDLSSFGNGIYFLQIVTEKGMCIKKIVKNS